MLLFWVHSSVVPFCITLQLALHTFIPLLVVATTITRHHHGELHLETYPVILPKAPYTLPPAVNTVRLLNMNQQPFQFTTSMQPHKYNFIRLVRQTASQPRKYSFIRLVEQAASNRKVTPEAKAAEQSTTPTAVNPSADSPGTDEAYRRRQAKVHFESSDVAALEKKLQGLQHVAEVLENAVHNKTAGLSALDTEAAQTGAAIEERNQEKAAMDAINNEIDKETAVNKEEFLSKEREMESRERVEDDEEEAKEARQEDTDDMKDLLEDAKEAALEDLTKEMKDHLEEDEKDRLHRTVNEVETSEHKLSDAVEVEDVMGEYAEEDAMHHDKEGVANALHSTITKNAETAQELNHRKSLEAKDEALAEQTKHAMGTTVGRCMNTTSSSFVSTLTARSRANTKPSLIVNSPSNPQMALRQKVHRRVQHLRHHHAVPQETAETLEDGSKAGEVPEPPQLHNKMRSIDNEDVSKSLDDDVPARETHLENRASIHGIQAATREKVSAEPSNEENPNDSTSSNLSPSQRE